MFNLRVEIQRDITPVLRRPVEPAANSGSRGDLINYGPATAMCRRSMRRRRRFTLVLTLMKCIATHVDFGLSRLSTPANLLVLLQRYIPT